MSLRRKNAIFGILVVVCLLAILLLSAQTILYRSFEQLEVREMRVHLNRVQNAMSADVDRMGALAVDWAFWDDTYNFVQGQQEIYLDSSLKNETLVNLGFNLVVIADASGAIRFAKAIDLESGEEIDVPDQLAAHLTTQGLLVSQDDIGDRVDGFVTLPTGIIQVASRPILTSEGKGPVAGTFIWGRFFDERAIKLLSEQLELPVTVQRYDALRPDTDFVEAQSLLDREKQVLRPLQHDTMAGYLRFDDIYGQPLFMLRVSTPRDIHRLGETSVNSFLAAVVLTGSAVVISGLVFLERTVLRRLTAISDVVTKVRSTQDLSLSAPVSGHDELAQLARGVNAMLDSVRASRQALEQSHDELERKVEERTAELSQLRARLEFVLSTVPAVIFCADLLPDWTPTFVSGNIRDLTGYDAEYFLDHPSHWREKIHPDDVMAVVEAVTNGFKKGSAAFEFRVLHRDGDYRWARGEIRLVEDQSGQLTSSVGYVADISALKRMEAELREALKHEQEINALKAQFVSMVSHEFRTPLAIIQTSADMLSNFGVRMTPARRAEQFDQISRQVRALTGLIDDILMVGRANRIALEATRSNCDLNHLLVELIGEVRKTDGEHDITLSVRGTPRPVAVDGKLIRQAVTNLLTNAVKYSAPNGHIQVDLCFEADYLRISVSDNGIGISPDDQARLFQAFHRGRNVGAIPGTGLGLAIVKQAIDAHGGTVTVSSEPGVGSTFTLQIPIESIAEAVPDVQM